MNKKFKICLKYLIILIKLINWSLMKIILIILKDYQLFKIV